MLWLYMCIYFPIAIADNEDNEEGSQTYSTPHDEVHLPYSMDKPTYEASHRVDELEEDQSPPPKRQKSIASNDN